MTYTKANKFNETNVQQTRGGSI